MRQLVNFIAFLVLFAVSFNSEASRKGSKHRLPIVESHYVAELYAEGIGPILTVDGPGCVLLSYTDAKEKRHEYWDIPPSYGIYHYKVPLVRYYRDLVLATLKNNGELEITHAAPGVIANESIVAPLDANGTCDKLKEMFPAGL